MGGVIVRLIWTMQYSDAESGKTKLRFGNEAAPAMIADNFVKVKPIV
jgi:hypothetical protein